MRYVRVLRERLWVIIACTVLVLAGAVAYVKLAPKTYTAQAELLVAPASPNDTVLYSLPVLKSSGDPTEDVLTAASLVTTPTVALAVVQAEGLHMSSDDALGAVQANPIGQAELVAVQAQASSPFVAQKLANGFAEQTIASQTAQMHAAIAAQLPSLKYQLSQTAPGARYGTGSIGSQVGELEQLLNATDPTLSLIAPASLPTSPSSPKTKLTLVAGALAGLVLGICAAFAFHLLDPRIRREEQIREITGLPILARIRREKRRRDAPMLPSDLSIASQEGYRTLRTTLTVRGAASRSRAFLVTGSGPGEGKSTTAINLAVALAQSGASVILIEADIRRPTFARAFGLEVDYGVEQVLIGAVELHKALVPVVFGDKTVHVLAARRSGTDLADRMSYEVTSALIASAKALADYVVVDSPPLTAVIDALPFAQLADAVVIVTRLDQSKRNKLMELDDLLRRHGAPALGVVLVGDSHHVRDYYQGYLNPTDGSPPAPEPAPQMAGPAVEDIPALYEEQVSSHAEPPGAWQPSGGPPAAETDDPAAS